MSDRRRTRTPSHNPPEQTTRARQTWTLAGVRGLGATTDLLTAGQILGLSRNTTYRLARAGAFPVPVMKAGARYRVPVAGLLAVLHLGPTESTGNNRQDPPQLTGADGSASAGAT